MKGTILKPILGGILAGAILFAIPFFVFKFLFFFFLISTAFRLMIGRRRYSHYQRFRFNPSMMDNVRKMNDEEYNAFRQHSQPIPSL